MTHDELDGRLKDLRDDMKEDRGEVLGEMRRLHTEIAKSVDKLSDASVDHAKAIAVLEDRSDRAEKTATAAATLAGAAHENAAASGRNWGLLSGGGGGALLLGIWKLFTELRTP